MKLDELKKYDESVARSILDEFIFTMNFTTKEVVLSASFYRVTNYETDSIQTIDKLLEVLHPKHIKIVKEQLESAISKKLTRYSFEIEVKHADGKFHNTRLNVQLHYNESEKPVLLSGISQDITEQRRLELEIRNQKELYSSVVDGTRNPIFELDLSSRNVKVYDSFYDVTGFKPKEVSTLSDWTKMIPEENKDQSFSNFEEFLKSDLIYYEKECEIVKADGSKLWVLISGRKAFLTSKGIYMFVGSLADIHKQKTIETELRNMQELYESLFGSIKEAIYAQDPFENTINMSDSFYTMTGHESSSITCQDDWLNLIVESDKDAKRKSFQDFINSDQKYKEEEFQIRKKDGNIMWVQTKTTKVKLSNSEHFTLIGSVSDVTERKEGQIKLHQLVYSDELTGLPNRVRFKQILENTIHTKQSDDSSNMLLFLDLDDFKHINDIYGHLIGDKVLCEIANRLVKSLPERAITSRVSGDEFAIIIPETSREETEEFIQTLIEAVALETKIESSSIFTTVSVGIVEFSSNSSDSSSTLLKNADIAMYEAKNNGKNRFAFFEQSQLTKLERTKAIESVLRTCIENNELSVVYQPIFNLKTEKIYGFESLLRLNSKKLGFISPGEFIPIAEKTGMIIEIGAWGIYCAAKKSAEWLAKGYSFEKLAYNVSHIDINSSKFFETAKSLSDSTGLKHVQMVVELTESGLVEFQNENISQMDKMLKLGLEFALDDFGTGYSSFAYLSEASFSKLKIDMSFIQKITQSEKDEKLVRNIIHMAHVLNMTVVAEGVETEEQYELLKQMDCDFVQGYYLSKPLTTEDAENLLRSKMESKG